MTIWFVIMLSVCYWITVLFISCESLVAFNNVPSEVSVWIQGHFFLSTCVGLGFHTNLLQNLLIDLPAGNIPAKLLLQMTTAFQERGLCDRSGKIFYKDHLHESSVPVLALAGDLDQICPPEAVYGIFLVLLCWVLCMRLRIFWDIFL